MNYMKQIADILGVPLNKKFRVKRDNGDITVKEYVLTQHGLYAAYERHQSDDILLVDILCGYAEVYLESNSFTVRGSTLGSVTNIPYELHSIATAKPDHVSDNFMGFKINATGTGVKKEESSIPPNRGGIQCPFCGSKEHVVKSLCYVCSSCGKRYL
jgi:Zn finger protein HypA/HybF involved in hydrogenase expression